MPNRGWTWIEEDGENEGILPAVEILVKAWNDQNNHVESLWFRNRRRDEDDGYADMLSEQAAEDAFKIIRANEDDPDEWVEKNRSEWLKMVDEAHDRLILAERQKGEAEVLKLSSIEAALSRLGVRMMRPYEHWNEDEKWMEYSENRHSDDDGYSMY
jgi:hypothetical protein